MKPQTPGRCIKCNRSIPDEQMMCSSCWHRRPRPGRKNIRPGGEVMRYSEGRICECGISHEELPGPIAYSTARHEAAEKAERKALPVWRQRLTARDETGRIVAPERSER